MSYVMGTVTVPGNATVPAFTAPPGYCNLFFYQPSQAQSVFLGSSTKVSSTNGLTVTPTPTNTETVVGSSGLTFFATTGNATAATFCYLISSTN
jgi:hypothetical protein